jgi:hypothetical protein
MPVDVQYRLHFQPQLPLMVMMGVHGSFALLLTRLASAKHKTIPPALLASVAVPCLSCGEPRQALQVVPSLDQWPSHTAHLFQ